MDTELFILCLEVPMGLPMSQTCSQTLSQTSHFRDALQYIKVFYYALNDAALGDVQVYPDKGTVAFSSGTKNSNANGKPLECSLNILILEPVFNIFDAIINFKKDQISLICKKLNVKLTSDKQDLKGKALLMVIMCKFLPTGDSLLKMIIINLPSPATAQCYHIETPHEGPMNDEFAIGIRDCDLKAPLVLYVSKMVPTSDKGYFYTFSHPYPGPNFMPGKKDALFIKSIQCIVLMIGYHIEPIEDCPSRNICGLISIDQFLLKSGTLTASETVHNMRVMKFSMSPVMQVTVEVKNAADLPKLVEGLKCLLKSDPYVQAWISDASYHIALYLLHCMFVCYLWSSGASVSQYSLLAL
ncbi:translation protein [Suillus hirtellus]|nr:translation protein [Suillus hirtellus]